MEGNVVLDGAPVSRRAAVGRLCARRLHRDRERSRECVRGVLPVSQEGAILSFAENLYSGRRMGDYVLRTVAAGSPVRNERAAGCQSGGDPEGRPEADRVLLV